MVMKSELATRINEIAEAHLRHGNLQSARQCHGSLAYWEDQFTILEWANTTFGPPSHPLLVALRMMSEVIELLKDLGVQPFTINQLNDLLEEEQVFARRSRLPAVDPEKVASECADIQIMVGQVCSRVHKNLAWEVDKKMAINRKREWKINENGVGQHVK